MTGRVEVRVMVIFGVRVKVWVGKLMKVEGKCSRHTES